MINFCILLNREGDFIKSPSLFSIVHSLIKIGILLISSQNNCVLVISVLELEL